MFVLVRVTNTTSGKVSYSVMHQESGELFELPDWAGCVAVDSDGEVYAYESNDVDVKDGHAGFTDNDAVGDLASIGKIPERYLVDGELEGWQWSKLDIDREVESVTQPNAVLDGSMLRARVIEMIDHNMKSDQIGARNARMVLRDVIKDGFTFKNYRTADLVLALVGLGMNLANVKDYNAFRAIDDAVQEARK